MDALQKELLDMGNSIQNQGKAMRELEEQADVMSIVFAGDDLTLNYQRGDSFFRMSVPNNEGGQRAILRAMGEQAANKRQRFGWYEAAVLSVFVRSARAGSSVANLRTRGNA